MHVFRMVLLVITGTKENSCLGVRHLYEKLEFNDCTRNSVYGSFIELYI